MSGRKQLQITHFFGSRAISTPSITANPNKRQKQEEIDNSSLQTEHTYCSDNVNSAPLQKAATLAALPCNKDEDSPPSHQLVRGDTINLASENRRLDTPQSQPTGRPSIILLDDIEDNSDSDIEQSTRQKRKRDSVSESEDDDEPTTVTTAHVQKVDRSTSILKRRKVFESVGLAVEVRHGDITGEDVGAIVNAANSALAHGGGVAGAISSRGGPEIQRQSNAWVKAHGHVPTGGVAVTGAGRLMAKYCIHAVGPIYKDGSRGEHEDLYNAVTNSLKKANELKLESISFPAISSGIFGFPKDECAQVMFDAVEDFVAEMENKPLYLKVVRFCNFDRPTVLVFMNEFDRRYQSTSKR